MTHHGGKPEGHTTDEWGRGEEPWEEKKVASAGKFLRHSKSVKSTVLDYKTQLVLIRIPTVRM